MHAICFLTLQAKVAIGRIMEGLEAYVPGRFPPHQTIINAYMVFEALTQRTYRYTCDLCGDSPPTLIFDLCKNTVFSVNSE